MKMLKLKFQGRKWSGSLPDWDSNKTLVLVFGGSAYISSEKKSPFLELAEKYKNSHILGCSTAGEIFGNRIFDDSLAVAILKFESTQLISVCVPIESADQSFAIGESIGKNLRGDKLKGVLVLSDGLRVNGSTLVKGINNVVDSKTIVTGGLAGDGPNFKHTWVLSDKFPKEGYVSAVGFLGDEIVISHGSQGGWDIFGPERIISESKGNIVYEIDGKPALELYKKYLGEDASKLPGSALLFPIQIRSSTADRPLVRTILAVSEDDQSMTFAGDMPKGSLAQLMRANFDRLIDGATNAAHSAKHSDDETLVVSISCVGRRLVLGERTEEELDAVMMQMPEKAEQIGFYSYGELSPFVKGEACELHNQTMTITTISEKKKADHAS